MCGFVGFIGAMPGSSKEDAFNVVKAMTDSIAHRGPDSDGHWIDFGAGVALGHRRLAIVDLSPAGEQPMISPSGRYVIAFNGEIYNHSSLRAEMLRSDPNRPWRGHSDTETLLASFDIWGIEESVRKCNGMFAFAVWDREKRELTLGRDRLGEKPLYYGWQRSGQQAVFLFASELKALRAHPSFDASVSRDALALYMRHMAVPGRYSIYEGIEKVRPGTLVTVRIGQTEPRIRDYWSVANCSKEGIAKPFDGSAMDVVDALESVLKDAIALQSIADVPLGAFLSGGVDSSTIAALMQANSSRPIRTFSIGFHEAAYNEAEHAKAVARHIGTDHTELYVSPGEAMAVIPKLPSLYDEPFADSSQIPTFLVSQLARKDVTVALSGDAGDELFGGYNRYQFTAKFWQRLSQIPLGLRRASSGLLRSVSPERLDQLAGYLPLGRRWTLIGEKVHKGARMMVSNSAAELYLGAVSQWSEPMKVVLKGSELPTLLTGERPSLAGLTDVEQMMALDMMTYLPDDILVKVDRAAMGTSLETRVPFLDHRVVEFAWRMPLAYKLRQENGQTVTKWALRQVLYRYVPQKLIERPKMGFGVPIDSWLRGPLREWAEDLLSESRLKREGFFDPVPIRRIWDQHLSRKRNWQHSLWCVLMFQQWLEGQATDRRCTA